jgi:CHAT domain-containing protein
LHQETNSEVRAHILILYRNTGFTQGQLGNLQDRLQSYQSGLDYAQHCLQSGERNNEVWEQILTLHSNYGATWEQLQQTSQEAFNLAPLGFWTWTMAGKVEDKAFWFGTLRKNWENDLRRGTSEPIFLNGIQNLLTNIIQTWHQPEKSHRLFASIPTETLLSIAESLYLLEQAKTKQFFTDSYQKLDKLHDNEAVFHLRKNLEKYHGLNKFCTPNWFNFLKCWWQKQQAERTRAKISELDKATMQNIQELINDTQIQLEELLNHLIQQQTQPAELYDLPTILLGVIFVCQKDDFEKTLEQWRNKPVWYHDLQQALDATHWQEWIENSVEKPLNVWTIDILYKYVETKKRIRLKIDNGKDNHSQPKLVDWLKGEIPKDKTQLPELLDAAWQNAQKQAKPLGYIFAILNDTDFNGNLSQQIENEEAQQQALIATLLGDGQQQLESKIKHWLTQQTDSQQELETLQQIADMQYRFQRLVDIHNIPKQIPYADSTYKWATILIKEILATSEITDYGAGIDYMTIKAAKIWSLLERSRIALKTNKLILPKNWEQILAQDLWNNLDICIRQVSDGHITQDTEIFPVIRTWLYTIDRWQDKHDTNYKICQQKLESNQVIMQPFIDQSRGIVRVLWLDKKQLKIYDFSNPEHAANWQTLIEQWQQQENWNTVLNSDILNSFAEDIENWAKNMQHIIAIFQTPLGQLAWEAMPQLANKLSREISIDHWLHCPKPQQAQKWVLGVTDFEKSEQNNKQISKYARFIPHETLLVANYWETEAQLIDKQPELNLFQALKKLREHQHIYISTHGVYNKNSPLQSGLSLCNNQEKTNAIDLPLWVCSTLRLDDSELMILSACETATNTSQQNLFDPLSIASVFAASGVNTVIATLSKINDIASLTFINELLNLAKEQPQTPWHQLIKQTREKFQNLTDEDMQQLSEKLAIITKNKGLLRFSNQLKNEYGIFLQPELAEHWANFIVIGDVRRNFETKKHRNN